MPSLCITKELRSPVNRHKVNPQSVKGIAVYSMYRYGLFSKVLTEMIFLVCCTEI